MIDTDFNIALDISSIIWDKNYFENNKSDYYELIRGVADFAEKIKIESIKVLARVDLVEQMVNGFPCHKLPDCYYEFIGIIYSFLGSTEFLSYTDSILEGIVSTPNQVKAYYNDITKNEIMYLISEMHRNDESKSKFFTFNVIWNGSANLKTKIKQKINIYETIIADNGNSLDNFFAKLKPKFEHNNRHNKRSNNTKECWKVFPNKNAFISRLSCYDGHGDLPQKILNSAVKNGNEYIGYDEENGVFVRFRCHRDNLYHGFDEYANKKIPLNIRKTFNK